MENNVFSITEWKDYAIPITAFILSLILGLLIEHILIKRLHAIARKTTWKGDDIFVKSIKKLLFLVIGLIGLYIALDFVEIKVKYVNASHLGMKVLGILIVTIFLKRLIVNYLNISFGEKTTERSAPSILQNVSKIIIYTIGLLIILQTLGVSITPIITALGIGGLAVALALQPTLSNLFSGIYILFSKHVRANDYVHLDTGDEGYVIDITWRNATIRDLTGNVIIIPNSRLAEAVVKNYHLEKKDMMVLFEVGVSYDSDLEQVEKVTVETAQYVMSNIEGGVKGFKPFIRYMKFDDFSINFLVYLKVKKYYDQYLVRHEFMKALHKRYNAENIEIPFPIRTIHMPKAEKK